MAVTIIEGWTSAIDFQLKLNQAPFDATGMAVDLIVHDANGDMVTLGGTVSWGLAASSVARYEPDAADFEAALSPYTARWKVTDTDTKVAYFPNSELGDCWDVYVA